MDLVSQEMLSDLYTVFCGRTADAEGLAFWYERLSHFTTQKEAMLHFGRASEMGPTMTSNETNSLDTLDIEWVMMTLINRTYARKPTIRERAYYLAQLASGAWEPIELAWELMSHGAGADLDVLNSKLAGVYNAKG